MRIATFDTYKKARKVATEFSSNPKYYTPKLLDSGVWILTTHNNTMVMRVSKEYKDQKSSSTVHVDEVPI